MEASVISLGVAALAVLFALPATVAMARQRPRAVRAAQARHPASTPPVAISLVREGRDARWRVEVRSGAPPTAVDIISYRASGSDGGWENEPIIEPIELRPGGWAVLPGVVGGRAPTYDVVMAWTEHRADGDRTGSGTFRVHEAGPVVTAAPGPQRGWVVAAVVLAVALVGVGALVFTRLADEWGDDTAATAPPDSAPTGVTIETAPTSAAPTTTMPPTTMPPTTMPPTTMPPTTMPPTTMPTTATATTAPIVTSPSFTPGTSTPIPSSSPSTSAPLTSSLPTSAPDGPAVVAFGRIDDCRFGSGCLVVGFSISGFDSRPTEYVCDFGDGERVTFGFVGNGATTACSARSAEPSITIEVDGVRSATITVDDLGDDPGSDLSGDGFGS